MSIEQNLWDVANELRANSELKSSEYSYPVLGLIFLKFADYSPCSHKSIVELMYFDDFWKFYIHKNFLMRYC